MYLYNLRTNDSFSGLKPLSQKKKNSPVMIRDISGEL